MHTSAVASTHSEVRAAAALGCTILSRQACLAELLKPQQTIAVAGSHGKTSTTWMLGHLMMAGGMDPVVMVGGTVAPMAGGHTLARASGRSLKSTNPTVDLPTPIRSVAIVTNLEAEHTDHYGNFAGLCAAFSHWLSAIPANGHVICPTRRLTGRQPCRGGIVAHLSCWD